MGVGKMSSIGARRILKKLFHFKRFFREQKGTVAIVFGLMAPILIGFTGLALDTGLWFNTKRQAQLAADAAAMGGVYAIVNNKSDQINGTALRAAQQNGFIVDNSTTITINSPPKSGAYLGDVSAVEVIINKSASPFLSAVVNTSNINIQARAVAIAKASSDGDACVLALNETVSAADDISGNVTLNFPGCIIASNSNHPQDSIKISGSANVTSKSLYAAGGISQNGAATVTLSSPATQNAARLTDPYKNKSVGSIGSCTATNTQINSGNVTLSPGNYCGGIQVTGHPVVTLNPGTYYVSDGNFNLGAQSTIQCNCVNPTDGVTIILTTASSCTSNCSGIGTFTVNGGASVNLRAPSADGDAYRGIVFMQDRRATGTGLNKFNGGATMNLRGAVYIPQQEIQWNGNNGNSAPQCTQIIGNTVDFTGNSHAETSACTDAGITPISLLGSAQLVE